MPEIVERKILNLSFFAGLPIRLLEILKGFSFH